MTTVKSAKLNGTKYNIDLSGPIDGCVDTPRSTIPTLMICCDLNSEQALETILHELGHIYRPNATEEQITQMAREQTRLLKRLGFGYAP